MNEKAFLRYHTWAVVGDVLNETKYAYQISQKLQSEGYRVIPINPRSRSPLVYRTLHEAAADIEVLDLVIHPKIGLKILEEAAALGVTKVLVQPGAESAEITAFAAAHGLELVEGCVLRALEG